MNMHKVLPIPILFRCKSCLCFFESVQNFYFHKKSCIPLSEFQKINCFIFEETNIEDDIIENGFRLASNYDSPAPIPIQNLTTTNPDDVSGSGSGSNVKTDVKLSSSALPMDTTEADCLQVIEYEYHEDSLVIKDEPESLNSRSFEQQFDLADPVPGPSIDLSSSLVGIQSVKSGTSKNQRVTTTTTTTTLNHIANPAPDSGPEPEPDPDIPPNPDGSDVIIQSTIIPSNSTINTTKAETETGKAAVRYKCFQCSKIFTSESQLQLHLRICERYKTKSYNCNTRSNNSSDTNNRKSTQNIHNQKQNKSTNNNKKSRTVSPSASKSNAKVPTPTPAPTPPAPPIRAPTPVPVPSPAPNSISNNIKIQVQNSRYEVKGEGDEEDDEEDEDDEGGTEPSKFVCQLCGCTFPYKNSLDNHLKAHSESLPFKCPRCKFTFHSQRHLTQHIAARHSDLRPVPLRSPFRSS